MSEKIEIVEITKTVWRLSGEEQTYETKEAALEAFRRKVFENAYRMQHAQGRVRKAKDWCSEKFREYEDYLLAFSRVRIELEEYCGATSASWEARGRTRWLTINQPIELVRTFPEQFLKQYVRLMLKRNLTEQVEVLRKEKRLYYKAVNFWKETRDLRFWQI